MSQTAPPARFAIGLTGGIGSGKSTVADLFAAHGASVIDTDAIAHQLTAPGGLAIDAIRAEFGAACIAADGAMDRPAVRALVFTDPSAKQRLEAILHPLIRQEAERAAAAATGSYVMFVVPLLVESGRWRQRVARVLVVDCPEQVQIARVMARSALQREQVMAIMAAQATRADRLAAADDVLVNDGSLDTLAPQVERLHAFYAHLASQYATP